MCESVRATGRVIYYNSSNFNLITVSRQVYIQLMRIVYSHMPSPKDPVAREEWKRKISEANHNRPPISEDTRKKLSENNGSDRPEVRAKISNALKGRKKTPEHLANIAAAIKNRSPEMREKNRAINSASKMGHIVTPETRLKISNSKKNPSQETLRKMSIASSNPSKETRERMSKAQKGSVATPETRKILSDMRKGEKHYNWKGGISFEPYCPDFNPAFKERCREFFDRVCVECGKTEAENGRKLDTHHVSYDKMVCCNGKKPLFVALCKSCHQRIKKNLPQWEQHFTEMINEKYGGKCYLPKKVALSDTPKP